MVKMLEMKLYLTECLGIQLLSFSLPKSSRSPISALKSKAAKEGVQRPGLVHD